MRACLKIIFSHLELHDLSAVARVSKVWCWNYWRSSDRDDLLLGALYKIFCYSEHFKWLFYIRHPKARHLASKGLAGFEEIRELYFGEFLKGAAKRALENKHNDRASYRRMRELCEKFKDGLTPGKIKLSENVSLYSSYTKVAYVFHKENHTIMFQNFRLNYIGQFCQYGDHFPYKHGQGKQYAGENYLIFEGSFADDYEDAGMLYSNRTGEFILDTRKEFDGTICKKLGCCITQHMDLHFVQLFIDWEENLICKFCSKKNEFDNFP